VVGLDTDAGLSASLLVAALLASGLV
jgi:hypothetical protein